MLQRVEKQVRAVDEVCNVTRDSSICTAAVLVFRAMNEMVDSPRIKCHVSQHACQQLHLTRGTDWPGCGLAATVFRRGGCHVQTLFVVHLER